MFDIRTYQNLSEPTPLYGSAADQMGSEDSFLRVSGPSCRSTPDHKSTGLSVTVLFSEPDRHQALSDGGSVPSGSPMGLRALENRWVEKKQKCLSHHQNFC